MATMSTHAAGAHEPVNVLLVDDQPGKLLSYEVMLSELGENLIRAGLSHAAAQAAAAPPAAEEPTDEHKRALAEYTSRQRKEPEPQPAAEGAGEKPAKPAEDQPTSELTEPVTSEQRP